MNTKVNNRHAYKVKNWSTYNKRLKKRASLTILIEESTMQEWLYQGKNKKGGNIFYSNLAIRLCLSLRQIFHLPLRQTEGFIDSLFKLMKISLPVPNYTTLSRRTSSLNLKKGFYHASNIQKDKILIIDSTGLSMYEAGEWEKRKRGYNRHKMWRKLHIVIDGNTQQVEMCQLTPNSTTDADMVKPLLEKKAKKGQKLIADRGYDQFKVYGFLDQKGITPVINPKRNAVEHNKEGPAHKARNKAIQHSKNEEEKKQWKKEMGYFQRALVETVMFRYKRIFGEKLLARKLENQQTEVQLNCLLLNKMLMLGKPLSYKVT